MDNFIKRIRYISFISAVSGAYVLLALFDFVGFRNNYSQLERAFLASVLSSHDYEAEVIIGSFSIDAQRNAPDEYFERFAKSSPPAKAYIGQLSEAISGRVILKNGIEYQFQITETIAMSPEGELVWYPLPEEEGAKEAGVQRELRDEDMYVSGYGRNCAEFRFRRDTTAEAWNLTCFGVWKAGQPDGIQYLWFLDGRAETTPFDVFKATGVFSLAGSMTLTEAEARAELARFVDRRAIGEVEPEKSFFKARSQYFNWSIKLPIINFEIRMGWFLLSYSIVGMLLAIFSLHAVIGLSDRATNIRSDEPWIILNDAPRGQFDRIIKSLLFGIGVVFLFASFLLQSLPTFGFFVLLGGSSSLPNASLTLAIATLIITLISFLYLFGIFERSRHSK
ncbi:hypothetical protein ABLN87_13035 [Ruegeria sp. SCPT10]|uniref:hypothetical protein n=1 Tax=Ruegeria sp. SCP10 TaxID=3141377 RepID=UPI0033395FEB